jgi:uncharacterized membrane protein YjfL (UPF0719 family)
MSGDEAVVLMASVAVIVFFGGRWAYRVATVDRRYSPPRLRFIVLVWPLLMAGVVFAVLRRYASHDVVDAAVYLLMYTTLGVAWVVASAYLFAALGLSVRDDVAERGNTAALIAILGGMTGVALAYSGGNIGSGPGWWVVVFAGGLATALVFASWVALEITAHVHDRITVDRDAACGWRIGAMLACVGAITGRAAAGDWVSYSATIRDFVVVGWPALALIAVSAVVEAIVAPRPGESPRSAALFGGIPAVAYVVVAIAAVMTAGWWK